MLKDRYRVTIYGRTANHGALIDVSHTFTSKSRAETFARAIARYLPTERHEQTNGPLAWVLVYALASDSRLVECGGWSNSYCYASFDPGAVPVKYHEIPRGYYGSRV